MCAKNKIEKKREESDSSDCKNPHCRHPKEQKKQSSPPPIEKNRDDSLLQIILLLTDIYYVVAINYKNFVTSVLDLFTFAWETIAFAWVSHLIPPDQYQEYRYNVHRRQGEQQKSHQRSQYREDYNFNEYEDCQFYPIPNVFDSWTSTNTSSSATSTQYQKASQQNPSSNKPNRNITDSYERMHRNDENDSSWGQFVDVDLSNQIPMSRKQYLVCCQ